MKKLLIPFLLIFIGLSSLSLQAQKSVTLRLNPKQGHTYTINSKASTMNMMEVQGQTMSSTQIAEVKQTFSTKDINEKEITFEGQMDAIKLTVSQLGMTLTYDSEHPENTSPLLADQIKELNEELHKPSLSKFDPFGNITDTEEETGFQQWGNVILPLPTEPVKEGSTWSSEKTQEISNVKINAKMTYQVKKISKKSIEIDITGTVEAADEASGTYEGTASIDPETGLVSKSNIKQNFSMTISEQGLTIPLTLTGTTTINVE